MSICAEAASGARTDAATNNATRLFTMIDPVLSGSMVFKSSGQSLEGVSRW